MMKAETRKLMSELMRDIFQGVDVLRRQGAPPHDMIIVIFDSGTRVGGDPMPFVFATTRSGLQMIAESDGTYAELTAADSTLSPMSHGLSESTVAGRVLRFLREEVGDRLQANVRVGCFTYVARVGDDLAVGTIGTRPN